MRTLSFSRSNERKLAGIVPCAIIAIAPTPTTPSHLLRRIADTRITQIPNARRYSTGDLSDNAAPNAEPQTLPDYLPCQHNTKSAPLLEPQNQRSIRQHHHPGRQVEPTTPDRMRKCQRSQPQHHSTATLSDAIAPLTFLPIHAIIISIRYTDNLHLYRSDILYDTQYARPKPAVSVDMTLTTFVSSRH